ncbi:outer membrane beta-barrel protein [Sphingomonas sp. SUN019]|uniref:outer membrane beta-barrel protein n=1 Tax=Sphingomonas sp. SUN019 TaxID=2937788 RepID=UPI0021647EA7|nr:outer membrane beta-barrel protein [Sphingomonas sp. SUN019]UVO51689.1 outer membrane beta-barrel protein [Sphingomonas sp. SUN019]
MVLMPAVHGSAGLKRAIVGAALVAAPMFPAQAQQERRGGSPLVLPRPGLEPVVRQIGPAELRLGVDVSAIYDSNVYATSANARDDVIAVIAPRAEIDWQSRSTNVHGEAYGNFRQYFDTTRENSAQFGAEVSGSTRLSPTQTLDAQLRFDRAVQSRADPEARAPTNVSPRKINLFSGEVGYSFRGGPFEVKLTPGFDRYDFLDRSERDRNMKSYRAAARVSYQSAAPVAFFLEGFATRRNFDLRRDFSGVDRDATTYGALLGASREVSGRLRGSLGVGVFRAEADDPALQSYTGIAVDGRVIWSPRARTALTFAAFRGNVATVRSGASGRTDTRASLRVDQEARHNLVWYTQAGWRRSSFRGVIPNSQDIYEGQFGAEYILSRNLSLFTTLTAAERNASQPLDEFSRFTGQLGVRANF